LLKLSDDSGIPEKQSNVTAALLEHLSKNGTKTYLGQNFKLFLVKFKLGFTD